MGLNWEGLVIEVCLGMRQRRVFPQELGISQFLKISFI